MSLISAVVVHSIEMFTILNGTLFRQLFTDPPPVEPANTVPSTEPRLDRHYQRPNTIVSHTASVISSIGRTVKSDSDCIDEVGVMERIFRNYTRSKVPVNGSQPVNVLVEFWIQEITSISDITQDFLITMYVSERWTDPGLSFRLLNPCKHNLTLPKESITKIWVPNLTFINSKDAEIHMSPFSNVWVLVHQNGSVWMNYRMNVTGPCNMELSNFPLDTNTCWLVFESYNYNIEYVRMKWYPPSPIILLQEMISASDGAPAQSHLLSLTDYHLTKIENISDLRSYPAGSWDELTIRFTFKRRCEWYILQAYIPTYLSIFISWISLCLGLRAIPARTMLVINSLLALSFQFGSIVTNLPRVSYVKAIDVWMLGCMTFVFCAAVELAAVGHLTRNWPDPTTNPIRLHNTKQEQMFRRRRGMRPVQRKRVSRPEIDGKGINMQDVPPIRRRSLKDLNHRVFKSASNENIEFIYRRDTVHSKEDRGLDQKMFMKRLPEMERKRAKFSEYADLNLAEAEEDLLSSDTATDWQSDVSFSDLTEGQMAETNFSQSDTSFFNTPRKIARSQPAIGYNCLAMDPEAAENDSIAAESLIVGQQWINFNEKDFAEDTPPSNYNRDTDYKLMADLQFYNVTSIRACCLQIRAARLTYICQIIRQHFTPANIDLVAAYLFPVVFTLFNIIYWGYYLYVSETL